MLDGNRKITYKITWDEFRSIQALCDVSESITTLAWLARHKDVEEADFEALMFYLKHLQGRFTIDVDKIKSKLNIS